MADVAVSLQAGELMKLRAAERWWEMGTLRAVLGGKPLGHAFGPDPSKPEFAFLAVDATEAYSSLMKDVKRSVVFLKPGTLVSFDFVVVRDPSQAVRWQLLGLEDAQVRGSRLVHTPVAPGGRDAVIAGRAEGLFLNVIEFGDAVPVEDLSSVNLAGVRVREWAVLFHADARSASSPVFFDARGGKGLKCLITGLAPGAWEVWRNGWLEDPGASVSPRAGALYFEGAPGDYFFRRIG